MSKIINEEIEFVNIDNSRFEHINNKQVVKLAAFLIENNDFIVYASRILIDCKSVTELNNSKEIIDFFEETSNCTDDIEQSKNSKFIDCIYSFYANNTTPGLIENIRGALLERITLLFIIDKYLYNKGTLYLPINTEMLKADCKLSLDCKIKISSAKYITKDPIDIVGFINKNKFLEVYESKVQMKSLKQSDIDILCSLEKVCRDSKLLNKHIVGVTTLSNEEFCKTFLEVHNINNGELIIYNRNNLSDLRKNNSTNV